MTNLLCKEDYCWKLLADRIVSAYIPSLSLLTYNYNYYVAIWLETK